MTATVPLTPEGEEEFMGAARGLGRIVPEVDVLLSSPYETGLANGGDPGRTGRLARPKKFPALSRKSRPKRSSSRSKPTPAGSP